MTSNYLFFVGIDWGTEDHQICVIGPGRNVLDERQVKHTGASIFGLADYLCKLAEGNTAHVAVAIETPRGAIVETLIERGFHLYAINPKQLDRFRDRHTVAGAKDDRLDALVLADSLRTDQHRFRLLQIDDPLTIQLREVSRTEDNLRQDAVRLMNRLRDQFHRYYPQLLKLCPNAGEGWLWSLWELAPDPHRVSRVRASRIEKILRAHRVRRVTAEQVLTILRETPLQVAPGTVEAAITHIKALLPQCRLVCEQRQMSAKHTEELLGQLPRQGDQDGTLTPRPSDVEILRSMPGVGRVVCATMFAEGASLLKQRDYRTLRSLAGVAPVTRQTGKQGKPGSQRGVTVLMRRACNLRLRFAVYHWARTSSQCDEASRQHYTALRERGHRHGRALRGVADRLLRILFGMLRTGTLYKPGFDNGQRVIAPVRLADPEASLAPPDGEFSE